MLVVEFPFNVAKLFIHVKVPVVDAVAFGAPALKATEVVAVLTHPFAGSVTVTVYAPAALTVAVAVLAPETIPGPVQV